MNIDDPFLNIRPKTQQDADFLTQLCRLNRDDLLQPGLP